MSATQHLTNKYKKRAAAIMVRATEVVKEQAIQTDPNVPEDTGFLRDAMDVTGLQLGGPIYRATLTASAIGDSGADYAAILELAPRIAPRKAKMLSFVVGGERVFSKGFDNRHYQWFSRFLATDPWGDAVKIAAAEVKW